MGSVPISHTTAPGRSASAISFVTASSAFTEGSASSRMSAASATSRAEPTGVPPCPASIAMASSATSAAGSVRSREWSR